MPQDGRILQSCKNTQFLRKCRHQRLNVSMSISKTRSQRIGSLSYRQSVQISCKNKSPNAFLPYRRLTEMSRSNQSTAHISCLSRYINTISYQYREDAFTGLFSSLFLLSGSEPHLSNARVNEWVSDFPNLDSKVNPTGKLFS